MKQVCDICGWEFDENKAFCDACGTPVSDGKNAEFQQDIPVIQVNKEDKVTKEVKEDKVTKEVKEEKRETNHDKIVGMGTYLGLIVLFSIPVLGLIFCILIMCLSKNKNIKNYTKAMLIWLIVGLIAGVCLVFAGVKVYNLVQKKMNHYEQQLEEANRAKDGYDFLGDLLEGFGGTDGSLEEFGDLGEALEQFGNLGETFGQFDENSDLGQVLEGFGDMGESLEQFGDLGESLEQFGEGIEQYEELEGLIKDLENSDIGSLLEGLIR